MLKYFYIATSFATYILSSSFVLLQKSSVVLCPPVGLARDSPHLLSGRMHKKAVSHCLAFFVSSWCQLFVAKEVVLNLQLDTAGKQQSSPLFATGKGEDK